MTRPETRPGEYNSGLSVVDRARVDRSGFSVGTLDDDAEDREFWRTKTPAQRLEALELMRQFIYGYDLATARLHRVLEVAELE